MLHLKQLFSTIAIALTEWRNFLTLRGCSPNLKQGLVLNPSPKGSGRSDISIEHDKLLVDSVLKP